MRVVFANTIRWIDGSRLGICNLIMHSGFAIALSDFAVYGKDTVPRECMREVCTVSPVLEIGRLDLAKVSASLCID